MPIIRPTSPESEKVGSGPGSCSDNKTELMLSDLKLHPAKITSLGTSKFGSSGNMISEKIGKINNKRD